MTEATQSLTLDRVREARRRMHAYMEQEMHELGEDPAASAAEALSMSGLDWLKRWVRPEIPAPPAIAVLLAAEWVVIEPSRVTATVDPAGWMFNPFGALYGGITATWLDVALGAAVQTTLPAGTGYATTDLHTRFVRAVNPDTGRLIVSGTVVHAGRRQATAEARVTVEGTGKLIATGTASLAIIRPS